MKDISLRIFSAGTFFLCCYAWPVGFIYAHELTGNVAMEKRFFYQPPVYLDQSRHEDPSVSLGIEYYHNWDNNHQSLVSSLFYRYQDSGRKHFDIRELYWEGVSDIWELRLGFKKVFWGVLEFRHLVDIINQTDTHEGLDAESKLGQPMANLTLIKDWGTFDLFLLPYFRERSFANAEDRLRAPLRVDHSESTFESGAEEKHLDLALRYEHLIGDWEIGFSHFYGTNRDPSLILVKLPDSSPVLRPHYSVIHQTALDIQLTTGNTLFKFEGYHRAEDDSAFNTVGIGSEYTFVGVVESSIDVGVLAEYYYDDRGIEATTPFENDLAFGTRIVFNDYQTTSLIFGMVVDIKDNSRIYTIEGSRRISEYLSAELRAQIFSNTNIEEHSYSFRQDDYFEISVLYNF
ncbi:hypothetical protein [Microbulbifer spongiae]|uniref:Uncharacterized protein n=1 Tax=Microbulbifer spongiae TaxID=2944933 RepID=A0ABY9EEW1_9GAMM|nr:hypothetical protein [Microbulbifer sp. MI-G]WKD51563.1 hypothetical protein M8T91_09120 [Microbulbifer sp. MI-G]